MVAPRLDLFIYLYMYISRDYGKLVMPGEQFPTLVETVQRETHLRYLLAHEFLFILVRIIHILCIQIIGDDIYKVRIRSMEVLV